MRDPGVSAAIEAAGSVNRLAEACGINPAAVRQWSRVPAERAVTINRAFDVPLAAMRPDLWPAESRQEAA